ncbi:MAG: LVIVD repeat-containing protein [Betaproteobacteria bacterium]
MTRTVVAGALVLTLALAGCTRSQPLQAAGGARLQGQVPLEDQASGRSQQPYASNVRLIGQQDIQNRGENGNLGWIGDCAYVAAYFGGHDPLEGMAVIDASNPSSPSVVRMMPGTPGTRESQVEANARRGAVIVMPFRVAKTPYGDPPGPTELQIYDASKDCKAPVRVGTYDFGDIVTHEFRISADGNTVYVTVSGNTAAGDALSAIDISDLARPKLLTTWDLSQEPGMPKSGMHDLDVNDNGTRAYGNVSWVMDGVTHQGLTILDTSEVTARRPNPKIRRVSSFNWGPPEDFGYTHSSQLARINGRQYVIAEDETMGAQGGPDHHGVGAPWGWARIIDVTDERYPLQVSTIKLEANERRFASRTDRDRAIYGSHYLGVDDPNNTSLVFFTWYSSGLRVWDVRDPYAPKEIGYYIPGARPDTKLAVSDSYPNKNVDYTYSYVRYRPETGHIWFNSLFNGFQIVELEDNPVRRRTTH